MIVIPRVRNKGGASTADILVEQILLCKETTSAINRIAHFRKEREIRDEINRRLRTCHDFMGMAGSRKSGCLYREVGLTPNQKVVCEHAIPVTAIVSLYEQGIGLDELVFYPVARILKVSDLKFGKLGLTKSGHDLQYPFMRYALAEIEIETHFGDKISCSDWSMEDHWDLIEKTVEMAELRKAVLTKISNW